MGERYVNGPFGRIESEITSNGTGSIDTGAIHRAPLEAEITRLRAELDLAQEDAALATLQGNEAHASAERRLGLLRRAARAIRNHGLPELWADVEKEIAP